MYKAGFIGCGNMGGALASVAAVAAGGENILIANHNPGKVESLQKICGCVPSDAVKIAEECRFVFLGVKPQVMKKAADEIAPALYARTDGPVAVSMAAGLDIRTVSGMLGGARVIRIMPNTPSGVGEGIVLYSTGEGITEEEEKDFLELMAPAGLVVKLPEEKIDGGSAISGCGPAFVCLMMEAMTDAGVRCGLPRDKAAAFVLQTFAGTAKLAQQSGKDPAELRAAVCSPAGSTIEGVAALEEHGVRAAIMDAVDASYRRTKELGK